VWTTLLAAELGEGAGFFLMPGQTPDQPAYRAFALEVLRIEAGRVVELTAFHDVSFEPFGLPSVLDSPAHR
jgi:hypothetical protein